MWNLKEVTVIKYRYGHTFLISFDDGVSGVVDFSEYLNRGPVFAPETLYEKCQLAAA